ncbi:MAG TPA: GNAT family N-acetyltransferase [Thermoanaerobaculia bacterium]|nr:GNAT family N-acetyltransferase [Thermoanaerobaculia bacterium]
MRTATRDDLPMLRELLRRANDTPYDLAAVAEEKCFGAGVAGEPVVRVVDDAGVAVTCGRTLRILAVDPAHRRRGIGSQLLRDASPSVIAAEAGNYFTPGVFADDVGTLRFFESHGYVEQASTYNLHAEISSIVAPQGPRLMTDADRERVLDFIGREFGKIWRFEASRGTIFFLEDDGEIAGFAAHEANNAGLGWFGPTGVAGSKRNRGFGRQLLLASLADLRARGYDRAIIAWTDALEFYRKTCNAIPAHRFVTYGVRLATRKLS